MSLQETKILIIDDDPNLRLLTRKILEAQGARIHECENLSDTYTVLKDLVPDLIILDLQLSENEHGSSFLHYRMSNSILKLIPVIICSSESRKEIVKKVIDLGINDYIIKPFRPDWLIKKIERTLKKQDHLTYTFTELEQQEVVTLQCEGQLISIGEANCVLRSPINFPRHAKIKLFLYGLQEYLNGPAKPSDLKAQDLNLEKSCRSNINSRPSLKGQYDSLFTLLGVSEREATLLRKLKVGWRKSE